MEVVAAMAGIAWELRVRQVREKGVNDRLASEGEKQDRCTRLVVYSTTPNFSSAFSSGRGGDRSDELVLSHKRILAKNK